MPRGKLKNLVASAAAALVTLGALLPVQAQPNVPNLEKLKQMKVSGTDPNIPLVPQTGQER